MPLTPNNREEHWLQGMVDGQTPLEPNKRREYWYKEIVDAIGSGGGGGVGVLVCNATRIEGSHMQLDKTVSEILDAFPNVIIRWAEEQSYDLTVVSEFIFDDEDGYQILFGVGGTFTAQTLNDYPTQG